MKNKYSVIYFLTWNCNLNCTYCYETNKTKRKMDWDTARKGIDFFMKYSNHVNFQFFGGEPLLQFDLIKKITDYLRDYYPNRYALSIYTNGTLIDNKVLEFFKKNNVFLTLSMDGSEETQDLNRVYKNNKGTFSKLLPILNKIVLSSIPVRVRMTVTPNNCNKLFDNIKFFHEQFGIIDIQEEVDRFTFWKDEEINVLIEQYKQIVDYIIHHYKTDETFYWKNYEKRISPFINQIGNNQVGRCGSSEGMCSLDTDGTLYPCQKFIVNQTLSIGHIDSGFNETQREIVRNYILPNYLKETRKCQECEFVNYCFAGCIADNYIHDTNQIQDCSFRRLHKGMHKRFYDELLINGITPRHFDQNIYSLNRKPNKSNSFAYSFEGDGCGAEGCGMEGGCGAEGCGAEGCGMEG